MGDWLKSLFDWFGRGGGANTDMAQFYAGVWTGFWGPKMYKEQELADCLTEGRLLKNVYEKAFEALSEYDKEAFDAYRDAADDINRVAFMECDFDGY